MEELGEDEDGGLPAHLEVDPQDGSGDSWSDGSCFFIVGFMGCCNDFMGVYDIL